MIGGSIGGREGEESGDGGGCFATCRGAVQTEHYVANIAITEYRDIGKKEYRNIQILCV